MKANLARAKADRMTEDAATAERAFLETAITYYFSSLGVSCGYDPKKGEYTIRTSSPKKSQRVREVYDRLGDSGYKFSPLKVGEEAGVYTYTFKDTDSFPDAAGPSATYDGDKVSKPTGEKPTPAGKGAPKPKNAPETLGEAADELAALERDIALFAARDRHIRPTGPRTGRRDEASGDEWYVVNARGGTVDGPFQSAAEAGTRAGPGMKVRSGAEIDFRTKGGKVEQRRDRPGDRSISNRPRYARPRFRSDAPQDGDTTSWVENGVEFTACLEQDDYDPEYGDQVRVVVEGEWPDGTKKKTFLGGCSADARFLNGVALELSDELFGETSVEHRPRVQERGVGARIPTYLTPSRGKRNSTDARRQDERGPTGDPYNDVMGQDVMGDVLADLDVSRRKRAPAADDDDEGGFDRVPGEVEPDLDYQGMRREDAGASPFWINKKDKGEVRRKAMGTAVDKVAAELDSDLPQPLRKVGRYTFSGDLPGDFGSTKGAMAQLMPDAEITRDDNTGVTWSLERDGEPVVINVTMIDPPKGEFGRMQHDISQEMDPENHPPMVRTTVTHPDAFGEAGAPDPGRTFLAESSGSEMVMAPGIAGVTGNKISSRDRVFVQYSRTGGGTLTPTRATQPRMEAGVYSIKNEYGVGIVFTKKDIVTDQLLKFEDSRYNALLDEIRGFWGLKEKFGDLGFTHKRGIVMYGAPGVGKTALIKLATEETVDNDHVVFYCEDFGTAVAGIKAFREVEPDRFCMFVFEDVDEVMRGSEHAFLEFMDGDSQTDGTLVVCTTNYLDRLPPRVLRTGRLDTKVEVFPPPPQGREAYFRSKLPRELPAAVAEMVAATPDFSFAECREFLVNRYIYGRPTQAAAKLVRSMDRSAGEDAPARKIALLR